MKQLAVLLEEATKSGRSGKAKVEDVKTVPELPKLEIKENERDLSPLIAGDWVTIIGPSLRDLSSNATQWWDEVVGVSKQFYDRWLTVGPMERLVMVLESVGAAVKAMQAQLDHKLPKTNKLSGT